MVDTLVLGTSVARRESSSLSSGTIALVTQWFRVPRLHRGGRWFESSREHHMVTIVQLVRTSDCGSEGRRFDSD